MKQDQEQIRILLVETIRLLCKNGLNFNKQLNIQGLVGITVDEKEVFLIQFDERISDQIEDSYSIKEQNYMPEEKSSLLTTPNSYIIDNPTSPTATSNEASQDHNAKPNVFAQDIIGVQDPLSPNYIKKESVDDDLGDQSYRNSDMKDFGEEFNSEDNYEDSCNSYSQAINSSYAISGYNYKKGAHLRLSKKLKMQSPSQYLEHKPFSLIDGDYNMQDASQAQESNHSRSSYRRSPIDREKNFVCLFEDCGLTFYNSCHLYRHQRNKHGHKFGGSVQPVYQCPTQGCDKKFCRLTSFNNHITSRHGVSYNCFST